MKDIARPEHTVHENPCEQLVAKMKERGYVWYWTVRVTDPGLAVSGPGAGKDLCEQKLSRFWDRALHLGLFTMEYYKNGELQSFHYLIDVEKGWGGSTPEQASGLAPKS